MPVGPLLPERSHGKNHIRDYGRCSLDGRSEIGRGVLPHRLASGGGQFISVCLPQ